MMRDRPDPCSHEEFERSRGEIRAALERTGRALDELKEDNGDHDAMVEFQSAVFELGDVLKISASCLARSRYALADARTHVRRGRWARALAELRRGLAFRAAWLLLYREGL